LAMFRLRSSSVLINHWFSKLHAYLCRDFCMQRFALRYGEVDWVSKWMPWWRTPSHGRDLLKSGVQSSWANKPFAKSPSQQNSPPQKYHPSTSVNAPLRCRQSTQKSRHPPAKITAAAPAGGTSCTASGHAGPAFRLPCPPRRPATWRCRGC